MAGKKRSSAMTVDDFLDNYGDRYTKLVADPMFRDLVQVARNGMLMRVNGPVNEINSVAAVSYINGGIDAMAEAMMNLDNLTQQQDEEEVTYG